MSEQYDNTNKGALWACKGFAGKVNIDTVDYRIFFVATMAKNESAPKYYAILRTMAKGDNGIVYPVFAVTKEGSKAKASFTVGNNRVFVFLNEKPEGNAPILRLSVLQNDDKPNTQSAPVASTPIDNDLPF